LIARWFRWVIQAKRSSATGDEMVMTSDIKPHTSTARRLVRAILGFGVGVAIGLAPYLGTVAIPGFHPLVGLYPASVRDIMLPLSAAVMGIVAVWVEWYGYERLTEAWRRRTFLRTLAVVLVGLLLLIVIHTVFVLHVSIEGGERSVPFVIGMNRQPSCKCEPGLSDAQCVATVTTFNPASIEACWGDRNVRVAKLALILSYLLFTGGFGGLVGLTLLRATGGQPPTRTRGNATAERSDGGAR